MKKLALSLLGPFQVSLQNEAITEFATDKIRALLAYLAVEGERPHRRQIMATLLWPDLPDSSALNNLRKSLHRLRQTVDRHEPGISDQLLSVTPQTVCLNLSAVEIDVVTFQALLKACADHPHRHLHLCQPCLDRLAQAAAIGERGEFLAGLHLAGVPEFDEWLLLRRESLQQQLWSALNSLTAALEQRGDYEPARRYAGRQISLDPYREESHRQLMRLLALSGQRNEVLAAYENCRRILLEELGVEPEAATTALYEQIRQTEAGSGRPLGQPALLHHFPAEFRPFVNRERELAQVQEQLFDPGCRLITVLGPGGIGKTRFCVRAAEQAAQLGFADGIYFFPLVGVVSADLLPAALANGLGLTLQGQREPAAQLLDYLKNKQCLLVLDNFEHLVQGGADLLPDVLAAAPGVRLLVSSREPLHVQAEWRLPLAGLDVTSPSQPGSALKLFAHVARQVRSGFELSPAEETAAIQICQLVQGVPLALEIAATWVRLMDCATIAEEIGRSPLFLTTPSRDLPDRHRSMAAVFDHSWRLLSTSEQLTLAKLSIFHGSFSLETALTVAETTVVCLAALVDKSLVQLQTGRRYALHELLRQFAAERLEQLRNPELVAKLKQRHSSHYLNVVAAREPTLGGPQPQVAVAAIQQRLANIRQAWHWARTKPDLELIGRSLPGLARFYEIAGLFREGETMMRLAAEELTAHVESDAGVALLAYLRGWQARFLGSQGRSGEAGPIAQTALALAEQSADGNCLAHAQSVLAEWMIGTGRYEEAKFYQQQVVDFYQASGARPGQLADALLKLTLMHWRTSNRHQAFPFLQQARPLAEAADDRLALAKINTLLGGFYWEEGDFEQAQRYSLKALSLNQAIGHRRGTASGYANLGLLMNETGKYDLALAYCQNAIELFSELGDEDNVANVTGTIGAIYQNQGEWEEALACHWRAIRFDEESGHQGDLGRHFGAIGRLYRLMGQPGPALEYVNRSLPLLRPTGSSYLIVFPVLEKAELLTAAGDYEEAEALAQEGLKLALELGRKDLITEAEALVARTAYHLGRPEAALARLRQLLAESNDPLQQATWHEELWRLDGGEADREAAVRLYQELYGERPKFEFKMRLAALEAERG